MSFVQVLLAGGLGNRLFEYAFARGYAERHRLELRCERSILNKFFQIPDHAPADQDLPLVANTEVEKWDGQSGVSIIGMGQHQKNLDYYSKAKVKEWFKLRPEYEELIKDVPEMDLVANPREGDYAYACNPMVLVSRKSYLDACDTYGLNKDRIFWLDGENHYRVPGIKVEKPWNELNDHQKGKLPGDGAVLDWLPDWAVLTRASVILRSNSTFSWWAATLGRADRVFAPDTSKVSADLGIRGDVRVPQDVPFVDGNHPPMASGLWFLSDLNLKDE